MRGAQTVVAGQGGACSLPEVGGGDLEVAAHEPRLEPCLLASWVRLEGSELMFTTRSVRLKELLVQKLTERVDVYYTIRRGTSRASNRVSSPAPPAVRESSLLATYWSEST